MIIRRHHYYSIQAFSSGFWSLSHDEVLAHNQNKWLVHHRMTQEESLEPQHKTLIIYNELSFSKHSPMTNTLFTIKIFHKYVELPLALCKNGRS